MKRQCGRSRAARRSGDRSSATARCFGRSPDYSAGSSAGMSRAAEPTRSRAKSRWPRRARISWRVTAARRFSREPPTATCGGRERLSDTQAAVPTLDELGRLVGLSRYQVMRRFEKVYGVPPHAWLLRRRVERARVLIRAGATLATAAQQAGFADQSHMTRAFARQFGFPPGAWRRASGCGARER